MGPRRAGTHHLRALARPRPGVPARRRQGHPQAPPAPVRGPPGLHARTVGGRVLPSRLAGPGRPRALPAGPAAELRGLLRRVLLDPDQGRINVCRRVVPDAELIHFAMPSVNGGVGRHQIDKGYGGRVCIPADRGDDPARVRELLRICDFYRSPFGSREALFLEQGVEGRQFEFDEDGNITQLSGATDEGSVTWLGLQKNQVNQLPLINEDLLENIMTTYEQSTESGELSAVDTLISGEYARQNAKLTEIHRDFFNAVVSGRRPSSDVDTFQQEWLDAGGQLVLEDFEAMLDEAS